jgi:hypothetical protein
LRNRRRSEFAYVSSNSAVRDDNSPLRVACRIDQFCSAPASSAVWRV